MRIKDCETIDDIVKYIIARGKKQDLHTLEIEQVQNILIITYGKLVPEKKKEHEWILILTTKVKKDNEHPMLFKRVKLNLCNFIEPYKSRKEEYERMRADATTIEQ